MAEPDPEDIKHFESTSNPREPTITPKPLSSLPNVYKQYNSETSDDEDFHSSEDLDDENFARLTSDTTIRSQGIGSFVNVGM